MAGRFASPGQSTVTFNSNPWWTGTDYHEQGMGFHVILPGTWPSHDDMGIAPNGVNGTSSLDGTPYMSFHQQLNPSDYVSFTLLNGSAFGLSSVQLADPNSPSGPPIPIAFIGYLADGSAVTNIFATTGNGATTLANYTFSPAFASGLTSVDIMAPRWAMDNLVFTVPEPSSVVLVGLGLIVLAVRSALKRQKAPASIPRARGGQ